MNQKETVVFGGGCFWCTEAVFEMLKGVLLVMPGYAGGTTKDPTYERVCGGDTGHAEVIKIKYDPDLIAYEDLLTVFFASHDPTTLNRQGADVGSQYRSVIFYTTPEQKQKAEKFINDLGEGIVTEVKPLDQFYEAESYHRQYYTKNKSAPYCQVIINPKLEKIKERFNILLKQNE